MSDVFGLSQQTIKSIQAVLSAHANVHKAVLYGSRAKGNYREGSDIDLTLFGPLDIHTLAEIADEIDDLLLPYLFDISLFDSLSNPELREHIRRVGKVFYEQSPASQIQ